MGNALPHDETKRLCTLCFLDLIVGLSPTSYSVDEGSSVEVCAVLGSEGDVFLESHVEVMIISESVLAEGKMQTDII